MIDTATLTDAELIVLNAALEIYLAENRRREDALVANVSRRAYDAAVMTALDLLCALDA